MSGDEQKGKEWYSNKDLFEMFGELKGELARTIAAVKEYNGLRECLNDVLTRVERIETKSNERKQVGDTIREWGGWILAIVVFLYTVLK